MAMNGTAASPPVVRDSTWKRARPTARTVGALKSWYLDLKIAYKLWIAFGLVFGVVTASGLVTAISVNRIEDTLRYVTTVAEPMSASAYEMEINAIGSGMGVMAYLHKPDPAFLARFREDRNEFRAFQRRYSAVAPTPEAQRLGERAGATYEAYRSLGAKLIADKDREVEVFGRFGDVVSKLDRAVGREASAVSRWEHPRSLPVAENLSQVRADLAELSFWLTRYLGEHGSELGDQLRRHSSDIRSRLRALSPILHDSADAKWIAGLKADSEHLITVIGEIIEIDRTIAEDLTKFAELRRQLDGILDEEVQIFAQVELLDAGKTAHRHSRQLQTWLLLSGLLAMALTVASVVAINRRVVGPVQLLAVGTDLLGTGRLDHRIRADSRDELGQLAQAFNRMAGQLQSATDHLEREVRRRTADLDASKQSLEQELATRRALERQLLQAQKMESLGTLAGGIAHDFNNMLYVILGSTELADDSLPPDSPARGHLRRAIEAGRRSEALVNKILSFSRREFPDLEIVQFGGLARDAMDLLSASMPPPTTVTVEIDDDCGTVLADAAQLEQVIVNLGINAFQAMQAKPGSVTVAARRVDIGPDLIDRYVGLEPGRHVELSVTDTGCGIAPEDLPRVIDPFFTTKPVGEGTGLGLSVAHGIVTSHGGALHIESELGRGTTVTLLFPFCPAISEDRPGTARSA